MKKVELVWKPKIGVGPFIFGNPIEAYLDTFSLEVVERPNEEHCVDWTAFDEIENCLRIYTRKGLIYCIDCDESCLFRGVDMVRASVDEVIQLVDAEPDVIEAVDVADEQQFFVEFRKLELRLWTDLEKTVLSVVCSNDSD